MHYADTHACPACRGAIDGQPRCPHCQLDLGHAAIPEIWRHLTALDQLVADVRRDGTVNPAPAPAPAQVSVMPPMPPMPRPGAPTPARPPAASSPSGGLTTGSVLLALGAAFLVIAGIIFVSFAWGVLGIGGRAAILALITAAAGGGTVWAAHRGLRGSAEALGVVTAGLTVADVMAAWGSGLLGLDGAPAWVVCSILLAGLLGFALAVVPVGRRHLAADLVSVQAAAGLAVLPTVVAVTYAVVDVGGRLFWALLVAALVGTAVGLVALIVRQVVTGALAFATTGAVLLVAAAAALVEAFAHPGIAELAGEAHGLPLLTVALAIAAGTAWPPARSAALAVSIVLAALLVALPLGTDVAPEAAYLWGAALVVALVVPSGRGPVTSGLRLAAASLATVVAAASLGWTGRVTASWVSGWDDPLSRGLLHRTSAVPEAPAAGWVVLLGGLALAAATLVVTRWEVVRPREERRHLRGVTGLLVAATALAALSSSSVPSVAVAGLVLAAGVGGLAVARTCPRGWDVAPALLLAVAPTSVIASRDAVTLLAAAAAIALAAATFALRLVELRPVAAAASTAWGLIVVVLLATRPDLAIDREWEVTIVLVVALAVAVVGAALHRWSALLGVELVAILGVALAIGTGTAVASLGWQAGWWTVLGVASVAVGLLVPGRRAYREAGAVALGLAWVLRLAASDVDVVEAYTAPFAVVALLVGAWAMHRDPQMGTVRALGAGLTLALLPSLPQALADPIRWRALVLALVAAVALGVGVWRHWQAPFVAGATVLALLVLVEVGPLALALPRWILIGLAGLVLLIGGITWEDRARDGRAAARFVRSMR